MTGLEELYMELSFRYSNLKMYLNYIYIYISTAITNNSLLIRYLLCTGIKWTDNRLGQFEFSGGVNLGTISI